MNMRSIQCLIVGASWLLALPAWPASLSNFGPEQPVSLADLRPHLGDTEAYSEQWSHGVWTPDGYFVGVDFAISNLGIGDHKGGFRLEFKDPSGKKMECKQEFDDDEWSASKDGFRLVFGAQELTGDASGLRLKVRCPKLNADLVFANAGPAVRPGNGNLRLEDGGQVEGTYTLMFTSPRANVTGQVVLAGQTIPIAGPGFCDHSYSDISPEKLARRWFRFKLINPDISIVMAELESTRELGSQQRGWVLVYDAQGRVLATAKTRFEYDGFVSQSKDGGYSIPRRVRLVAADGENTLTGTLRMTGVKEIRDPTANLDGVRRAIVQQFSKPRDYSLTCSYQFQLKQAGQVKELKGEGVYRFVFVNP
jgi:hypothetical protein